MIYVDTVMIEQVLIICWKIYYVIHQWEVQWRSWQRPLLMRGNLGSRSGAGYSFRL